MNINTNKRNKFEFKRKTKGKRCKHYFFFAFFLICYDSWKIFVFWNRLIKKTEDNGIGEHLLVNSTILNDVYMYKPPKVSYETNTSVECGNGFILDSRLNHDQDKIIFKNFFLDLPTERTYIEIGAYEGIKGSILRYFDLCLGWEGLVIEANPKIYNNLVRNRPSTHKLSFSPTCSDEGREVDFYAGTEMFAGLVNVSNGYRGKNDFIKKVPCGPLGPVILSIFGNKRISLLQMHIENAEYMALQTINFDIVQIDVMVINIMGLKCKGACNKRDEIRKLLRKAGYQVYEGLIYKSDVYVHRNRLLEIGDAQLNNKAGHGVNTRKNSKLLRVSR